MIYTIYNLIQNRIAKKSMKEFGKNKIVLSQKEIDSLSKSLPESIPIFESAIVSHKEVDGKSYYTRYPFNAKLGHDNFRKASIGDLVGKNADILRQEDIPNAVSILEKLSPLTQNYNPTKIIAWNSLGKLAKLNPELYKKEFPRIKEALKSDLSINTLGALTFTDSLQNKSELESLLTEALYSSENIYGKALIISKLYSENINVDKNKLDKSLNEFYEFIGKSSGNGDDVYDGMEISGIMRKSGLPLWDNTPHKKIINRTIQISREYLQALGSFSTKSYKK